MKIQVKTLLKYSALLLCLSVTSVFAQDRTSFKYLSRLPKVDSAGYYHINLAPGLTGRSRPDLADVRIVDGSETFVPYVKSGSLPVTSQTRFVTFQQANGSGVTDSSTIFIAQNPTGAPVNKLWLKLKNTAVNRQMNVSGSDDLKNWFAIAEDVSLATAGSTDNKGTYQQSVDFPASNFKYLKLTIANKHKSPLLILGAGIYTDQPAAPKYIPITGLRFTRADSPNHITHIRIKFDLPYRVDKLIIPVVYNSAYFRRQVNVFVNDSTHAWLTSKTFQTEDEEINLAVVVRDLDVQITNNDDEPLPIKKVSAYQTQNFLIAHLDSGKTYALITGNPEAKAPKYDLEYFANHLTGSLPELMHQNMQHNPVYKRKTGQALTASKKGYWLWAGIAVAIAMLSALTFSMMKEVKKREDEKGDKP